MAQVPGWQPLVGQLACGAAFGVPIITGDKLLAVLLFLKTEVCPADQRLLELVLSVATQLGSVLERKRVQEEKAQLFEKVKQQREQLRTLAFRRRHLAQQIILTQEEERRRVSRELHDEAGQALTALKVSMETMFKDLTASKHTKVTIESLTRHLSESISLCDSTSARIRELAHNLRPAALDDLGLLLALEGFCRDFAERTHLAIRFTGEETDSLSAAAELCLYRFLQEGLTNVAKHARASSVWVVLEIRSKAVFLSLKDDGRGFDMQAASSKDSQGIGLLGIEERLETLGGRLEIKSELNKGTCLIALVPFAEDLSI